MTSAYLLALTLVAFLSVAAHLVLDSVINEQLNSANVLHVAGQQSMYPQRITYSAMEYVEGGDPEARERLEDAIKSFRRNHTFLMTGGFNSDTFFELSTSVRDVYYGTSQDFDRRTRQFIAAAEKVASTKDPEALLYLRTEARKNMLNLAETVARDIAMEANARIERLRAIQKCVVVILLLTLALEGVFIFRPLVRRIVLYATRLYEHATRDPLTGLLNRRAFFDFATRVQSASRRYNHAFSVIMLDIDHFKKINDTFGHDKGDDALRLLARILNENLRESDIVARMGGEEFVIALPNSDGRGATIVAESLRKRIEETAEKDVPRFTISVGVTEKIAVQDTVERMLKRADDALYQAKRGGRNRVQMYEAAPVPPPTPVPSEPPAVT
ncbi:diguanylate cyclase [Noviherbaspirillum pedocola]|uniref:diguanylate cyclase n=1 Tax=Noviherbaspirillum pedocola TaxID=2801341 RepID=A0A934W6C7_9BURK|nr:diguanylate cyclase [Noviherbaspirillum pedocola]MBK4736062.1 diguanylate cyclase [Noviherbaspirillum pedocola]